MSTEAGRGDRVSKATSEAGSNAAHSAEDDARLEDLAEGPSSGLRDAAVAALRNPVVHRALIGIALALLVLAWPQRSERVLARLVGLALLLLYGSSFWATVRHRRPGWAADSALSLAAMAVGTVLLLLPGGSQVFLGRTIGVILGARALKRLLVSASASRTPPSSNLPPPTVASDLSLLVAAAALIAFPAQSVTSLTTLVALGWIAFSVAVIAICVDRAHDTDDGLPAGFSDATELVSEWMKGRSKSVEDRDAIISKVLFDGPEAKLRYVRFFTLMSSAAVIASMGVITESTAVVIGAMLIAPLMTPLMGMAMSLVMGWPRRLALSAATALGGIVVAIGTGLLLGLFVPAVIDPEANIQILSRSSPTTLDLIVALAAGAAGAYALSRPDVSDSLPGVAIAISLVPPLTVVGISYSQGSFAAGNGALLLFATNMVAILIMGGATFVLTGVTPLHRVASHQHRMQTSLASVAALAILVVAALFLNGATIAANALRQSQVESSVEVWLEDHAGYELNSVRFEPETVVVVIAGPAEGSPQATTLARRLAADLEEPVTVSLRHVVVETTTAEGG